MVRFAKAFGALICLSLSAGATAAADDPRVPVRVAVILSSGQGEVGVAIRKYGLDKKYGIDFTEVDYAAPGQQYTLLRSEAADVTAGNFIDLLRQRRAGNKMRAFHSFQGYSMRIVVKPDSPIKTFADLKGKNLGNFGTTFLDWLIIRAAGKKAYGLDVGTDTNGVPGAPPLLNQLLARGAADATLQFPPLTIGPLQRGEQRVLTTVPEIMKDAGFNPGSFYLQWMVSEKWSTGNPIMIDRLSAMLDEAYLKLGTDNELYVELAQKIGITDPVLVTAYREMSRLQNNPAYNASLAGPTQDVLDSIVAMVGEGVVGVAKLDPDAFLYPRR